MIIGTNPKEKIEKASQLLPDDKMMKETDTIDAKTELINQKGHKLCNGFLAYLRSVLSENNYKGSQKNAIRVSSPCLIDFELIVLDFAVKVLQEYSARYFTPTDVNQDISKLSSLKDGVDRTTLQYNIGLKIIHQNAIKLYKVLIEILTLIDENKEPFTSACFKRIESLEQKDSIDEIYERRMALRQYFKELKMNQNRINQQ